MAPKLDIKMETWTWEQFIERAPPHSIALDGFVAAGPKFSDAGPHVCFNHHEGVSRLETRATCGQTLMAVRVGLFKTFDHAETTVYVNDCDEDVCLSWFLLKHAYLVTSAMNPIVNRLVHLEDMLDTTAGAYPLPVELPALEQLAWVFEPYRRFRANGLDQKVAGAYRSIIEDVTHRILRYVSGNPDRLELDGRYEVLGGGPGWLMVKELGAQARAKMFADGVNAFVSVRERPDGTHTYTIGRTSVFIRFPVTEFLRPLNEAEAAARNVPVDQLVDRWGGADSIIGSPRATGSALSVEAIHKVIERERAGEAITRVGGDPCPSHSVSDDTRTVGPSAVSSTMP